MKKEIIEKETELYSSIFGIIYDNIDYYDNQNEDMRKAIKELQLLVASEEMQYAKKDTYTGKNKISDYHFWEEIKKNIKSIE